MSKIEAELECHYTEWVGNSLGACSVQLQCCLCLEALWAARNENENGMLVIGYYTTLECSLIPIEALDDFIL